MPLHSRNEIRAKLQDSIFGSKDASAVMPKYKFPSDETRADVAFEVVRDELFQRTNRHGVQAPIMLVQAIIVTVLAVAFVVIPGVSDAFWVLQAMTAILYLLMYVLMFAAAWRLRIKQPDLPRQFRVPLLPLVAAVGILASIAGIAIGLVPPSQFKEGPPATYALLLIVVVAVLALPPQVIYQLRRPQWRSEQATAASEAG